VRARAQALQQQLSSVKGDVRIEQQALVAAKPVARGAVLLNVPDSAWLTAAAVQGSPVGAAARGEPLWVQLALSLAAGAAPGSWGAWLDEVAAHARRPVVLWSNAELRELEGTQVLSSAIDYRCAAARSSLPELTASR